MAGYWRNVPKGVWTVVDPSDADEVLRDPESRAVPWNKKGRINVYGPRGKAIIIDLIKIRAFLGKKAYKQFLSRHNLS